MSLELNNLELQSAQASAARPPKFRAETKLDNVTDILQNNNAGTNTTNYSCLGTIFFTITICRSGYSGCFICSIKIIEPCDRYIITSDKLEDRCYVN